MADKITGRVLNIQHFCVDDGPGIRTTVFLKGCPLRCAWCHNPESQAAHAELFYRADRCAGCGACVSACPTGAHALDANGHTLDREKCVRCMKCVSVCRYEALEAAGKEMSVEEVFADLSSDRIFYETSGGGITLSGGEPTAQPHFSEALLALAKAEKISTAVETCAYCTPDTLLSLAAHTDLFLVDWKVGEDALHRRYTGVSNQKIRENLARLCEIGARVILRCPLIPDVNMTEAHYESIAEIANTYANIERIDLEPYHPMGVGKSEALGVSAPYENREFLSRERAAKVQEYLVARVGVPVLLSGG